MSRNHHLYLAYYQQRRIIKLFTKGRPDVKAVAFPALPDQRDVPANRVNPESQEIRVIQAFPVFRHQKFAYRRRLNHANRVRLVHPDLLARLAKTVSLDQPVETVHPEKMAQLVLLARPALLAPRANLVETDLEANQAEMLKATILCPANVAPTENQEKPDPQALQARPVKTEHQVSPDLEVPQVRPVNPAKMEKRATKDHLVNRANPEKGACVRNIAPWTVVCFSKMARGDKLFLKNLSRNRKSKKNAFPKNVNEFFSSIIGLNFYNNFTTTLFPIIVTIIIGYVVYFNIKNNNEKNVYSTGQSASLLF